MTIAFLAYKFEPDTNLHTYVGADDEPFALVLNNSNGADVLLALGLPPDPSGIVPIERFRQLAITARRRHLGQRSAKLQTVEVSSPGRITVIFGGRAEGFIEQRFADLTALVEASMHIGATHIGWG